MPGLKGPAYEHNRRTRTPNPTPNPRTQPRTPEPRTPNPVVNSCRPRRISDATCVRSRGCARAAAAVPSQSPRRPRGSSRRGRRPTRSGHREGVSLAEHRPDAGGADHRGSGVIGRPKEAYAGQTGGGLWKTVDGGETWAPVTDGQIGSASVGAVAVSLSNPDVVYIGTGESCIRGNIQPGDGVYKSTDAGQDVDARRLRNSDAISRIRIHPTNPDIVFVADFGKLQRAERRARRLQERRRREDLEARPLPRRQDRRSRHRDRPEEPGRDVRRALAGVPRRVLDVERRPGQRPVQVHRRRRHLDGNHPQSGTAAGHRRQDRRRGVSCADSNRVYALVENANGGLFSSDDGGRHLEAR